MTLPYDNYYNYLDDNAFDELTFDHTDIFILNPNTRQMELRSDLYFLYTTFWLAVSIYMVTTFLANSSMEYRRAVNYYSGAYLYSTDDEDSEESSDEENDSIDYSPTKSGYAPSVLRHRYRRPPQNNYSSSSEEPEEASEEDESSNYDIPELDYNESNLMERVYRLD